MSGLARRRFLQGGLAAAGLGLVSPVSSLAVNSGVAGKRLLVMMVPNGHHPPLWLPEGEGSSYRLAPGMAPLEAIRDRALVVSNLSNAGPIGPSDRDHPYAHATLLPASGKGGRAPAGDYRGWSFDQVAADQLGQQSAFSSLQVASETPRPCHGGGLCSLYLHASWRGTDSPLPPSVGLAATHARLFATSPTVQTPSARAAHARAEQALYDLLHQHSARYGPVLSSREQLQLDRYLEGVDALERRASLRPSTCAPPASVASADDPTAAQRAMADTLIAALACDLTRVVTWELGAERSDRSLGFLGHAISHHDLSHFSEAVPGHAAIDAWYLEQLVYVVQRLDQTADPLGGSLLDHTVVAYVSSVGHGERHTPDGLDVILAGGGLGGLGEHRRMEDGRPLADLWLGLLRQIGAEVDRFGYDGEDAISLS